MGNNPAHAFECKPPHDEIEVLKAQIAALKNFLAFVLVLLERISGDAIARNLIDKTTVIAENDLRGEGFNHILHDLRETLERYAA